MTAYMEFKQRNCKGEPTPIYCKSCGKLIGRVDHINQLQLFRDEYGKNCGFCGAELSRRFRVKGGTLSE